LREQSDCCAPASGEKNPGSLLIAMSNSYRASLRGAVIPIAAQERLLYVGGSAREILVE
jgi:hypothetical protein